MNFKSDSSNLLIGDTDSIHSLKLGLSKPSKKTLVILLNTFGKLSYSIFISGEFLVILTVSSSANGCP